MLRALAVLLGCAALVGCMTPRAVLKPLSWDARSGSLQKAASWSVDGRAAVAIGTQGWQASLSWRQHDAQSVVHLAGPFGIGALTLERTPQGVALNGAPPSDAVVAEVQEKLGFDLPLDQLRYWLLGVPSPASAFELTRNERDRAQRLAQDGWVIDYDRYMPVAGDVLPAHFTMTRDGIRVRIAVDRWEWLQ